MARSSKSINKKPKIKNIITCITCKFKGLVDEFIDEHNDTLKELAKR